MYAFQINHCKKLLIFGVIFHVRMRGDPGTPQKSRLFLLVRSLQMPLSMRGGHTFTFIPMTWQRDSSCLTVQRRFPCLCKLFWDMGHLTCPSNSWVQLCVSLMAFFWHSRRIKQRFQAILFVFYVIIWVSCTR